jgi:hypothetical protein
MKKYNKALAAILILLFSGCGEDKEPIEEFSATISVSATPMAVSEGDGEGRFLLTLSEQNTSGSAISIPYTLSGTASSTDDFTSSSQVAQIDQEETTTTISIDITDDNEVEENETIILTLGNLPSGITAGTAEATVTIQDDDTEDFSAIASISIDQQTISEDDSNITFNITLNKENSSGGTITIPLTIAGTATDTEDFTTTSLEVEIGTGETSATFDISIIDDEDAEDDETIILAFGTLPDMILAGTESATLTIEDNDEAPFEATVSVEAAEETISEGDEIAIFTISLDTENTTGEAITIPFEISGTAVGSEDYTSPTLEVQINDGETSATVEIQIIDDEDGESDETIILTLGTLPDGLTEDSGSATITIQDNDQTGTDLTVSFGTNTGNTIEIDSWTNIGSDSYLVVINTEDSFSEFSDQNSQLASTTYIGYGEQVVYNSTTISSFEVSLLSANTEYYFKVIPKSGSSYDNSQNSANSNTNSCVTTSTTEGQVCFDIGADTRTIVSNQLANHEVGSFPNADPTAIAVTRELDLTPTYTNQAIYVYDETGPPTPSNDNFWQFGIASNGVEFHPMGLKPWENPNTGEENWEWQAKVTEEDETGLDAYGAHVTTAGNYHYHGDIVGLADEEDGSRHSLIYGFAADGFPIYYKYGYSDSDDPASSIIELQSSYQLKNGSRTGSGTAGEDYPDGTYDGTYIQDFEYIANLGDLDECNGRTGITPEFPDGTYYYVITSDFPVTPNCFFGTPADDWKIGR